MYQDFFGLDTKPFNITPDTHFLYPSTQHQSVIQTLSYGIQERKGFLLLTGEVGMGKTTSIRALLNGLGDDVQTSMVLNPLVSTLELIKSINKDFGCSVESDSVTDQIEALHQFVLECSQNQKNALVIIDEAQNLSVEALEATRLLSNLETESSKLLQILLVGQPELNEKLAERSLRQLAQRIQVYAKIEPLTLDQTENYIKHRIEQAGPRPVLAFERSAIKALHKLSGGIPRIINTLCELTLLVAFSLETRVITKRLIRKAAKEAPLHVYHH